ncbi:MAG: hypothetical protein ACK4H7_03200 [Acidilobaceae archaeon]
MASRESKGKKPKKVEKVAEVKGAYVDALVETGLAPDLIEKARREVVKEKYLTPFRVAQKYGIKVSTARRLLKILAGEGVITLHSSGRRAPIYVPKTG